MEIIRSRHLDNLRRDFYIYLVIFIFIPTYHEGRNLSGYKNFLLFVNFITACEFYHRAVHGKNFVEIIFPFIMFLVELSWLDDVQEGGGEWLIT